MEPINNYYNHHYIRTDASGRITDGWSDGPHNGREPTEDDILLSDKGGYQFRLVLDGEPTEENPPLYDGMTMIPLYKWDGERVLRRSEDEIEADRAATRERAEQAKRERIANDPQTLLLEMAADHEERICLMELGVTQDDL